MLIATVRREGTSREETFHIGDRAVAILRRQVADVEMIQADGDELDSILTMFGETIPHTSATVQRWYGDLARQVAFSFSS